MEALRVYPPSDHTHSTLGLFSPLSTTRPNYPASTAYSDLSQTSRNPSASPPLSPTKHTTTAPAGSTTTTTTAAGTTRGLSNLPPATDSLINLDSDRQPSLAARLHRRKKTYQPPTAPASKYSQPHDPLRAARLAWRLQEEYAEQVRLEEEHMMHASSTSFHRKQRESAAQAGARQTAPTQRPKRKKAVRSKWTAFVVWFKLGIYRFTRGLKSMFRC
jgi:hypothetical protein